jgi:alkanesulfonate monooxygenase SsuD/methylene tetrahydromethanopterin reductase-like flavin-dependent oxidoreductase (luciferase family)
MTTAADRLAAVAQQMRDKFDADRLAGELGCEVTPHPELAGRVDARDPLPGLWLLTGTPDEVRAEVRAEAQRRAEAS